MEITATPLTLPSPALLRETVHLWSLDMDRVSQPAIGTAMATLDDSERARSQRYRTSELRQRFALGRGMLRFLIGQYLGIDAASVRFQYTSRGKPHLSASEPDRGLVFNLAHSRGQALFAFARDVPLGVDLEARRSDRDLAGLAERCLSANELSCWQGLSEPARTDRFYDIWASKEAFLKATGTGIGNGLKSCVVNFADHSSYTVLPPEAGSPDRWRLFPIRIIPDFSAAVCVQGEIRAIRLGDLNRWIDR